MVGVEKGRFEPLSEGVPSALLPTDTRYPGKEKVEHETIVAGSTGIGP